VDSGDSVDIAFRGTMIEWRGPAPYFFVPVPEPECEDIREVAAIATYGWGVIPVEAEIGDVTFTTSLFPREGGYLLPVKDAVRKPNALAPGDEVQVRMAIRLDP
jgi:hypothetical protein